MPRDADSWLRALLLGLALALGLTLRLAGVGESALFGDEFHTVPAVDKSYREIFSTFDEVGSHVVLPALQKLALDVTGAGVLALRLPAIVPGILLLLVFYPLARSFVGRSPALVATLFVATSPMLVYYSRFGRSYALLVLLGMVLAWSALRALRAAGTGGKAWPWWTLCGLCAVLLPYTHLSSIGFVATVAAAVAVAGGLEAGSPRGARAPAVTFAAAAVVVVLLYLPLAEQVRAFREVLAEEERSRPLGWFGIPTLLAGGRAAAVVFVAALPVALVGLWRARPAVALVTLGAFLGPVAVLLVTRPHGMDYAYARYLLNSLPFLFMATAWLLEASLARLRPASFERWTASLGAVLVLLLHLAGPLGPGREVVPRFDNTYLAMRALPAFDVPNPRRSEVYALLRDDPSVERIVEAQPLFSRAVLLLRNHALLHEKEIVVGWLAGDLPPQLAGGGYVPFDRIDASVADVVVLHKDLRREVRAYWRFVYGEAWPEQESPGDESFMKRHESHFIATQNSAMPAFAASLEELLRERHGEPFYEDDAVLAWRTGA